MLKEENNSMTEIYKTIGEKIKELRSTLSQEELAIELEISPNTLSRWETGTYKPKAADLDTLSRHFRVPITVFFPDLEPSSERVEALTSATGGLSDDDFDEVLRYAEFRKANQVLKNKKNQKK